MRRNSWHQAAAAGRSIPCRRVFFAWLVFAVGLISPVVALGATRGVLTLNGNSAAAQVPWNGGQVLHSSSAYLIFWAPSGESIPSGSEGLIERFLTDAAADSGKSSNAFGVLRQYYDRAGFADYRQTFNAASQVIVDQQPYPPHDPACTAPDSAYPTCLTDPQIQAELTRLISADRLPTDGSAGATSEFPENAPVYFVVLPADVDACLGSNTQCSNDVTCAWHSSFVTSLKDRVLYAALPLDPLRDGSLLTPEPKGVCQTDGTSTVQALDGDVNADLVIDSVSHEYSETITDPVINTGWAATSTNNEIGDECESYTPGVQLPMGLVSNPNSYRPTLGGSEPAGTLFTQLINGHPYYIQSEWSDGDGNCEMRPSPGKIVPRFTVPPGRNTVRKTLSFNPAASTSRNHLSSATWNFGDGSTPAFVYPSSAFFGSAVLIRVKHTYRRPGRYTITLTLVDNRGNLQTTTRRLTIHGR